MSGALVWRHERFAAGWVCSIATTLGILVAVLALRSSLVFRLYG